MSIFQNFHSEKMQKGRLYLIPTPLGESETSSWMGQEYAILLNSIHIYIVEEIRTARRFLRKAGFRGSIDNLIFRELNEHTPEADIASYLDETTAGHDIGLLSEAGLPCVADPGNLVVRQAHRYGIKVIPLVGPSSIMLALMASGLNGQHFTFHGYLPVKPAERATAIKRIEKECLHSGTSQIFIETPYRNLSLLESLIKTCLPDTYLCIASDISQEGEIIRTLPMSEWKKEKPDLHKRPAVFILGR
jgi:16S rRNA (cytidine1402-2'-O)-methyltransferase